MAGRCFLVATNEGKIQRYSFPLPLCVWLPRLLHFVGDDLWTRKVSRVRRTSFRTLVSIVV
jgi:hypothetical protein